MFGRKLNTALPIKKSKELFDYHKTKAERQECVKKSYDKNKSNTDSADTNNNNTMTYCINFHCSS